MGRPKKLTLDFFIHDAGASSDIKIKVLRKKHGNDGYATFFTLLEMICSQSGMKLDLSDSMQAEVIAEDCHLRDIAHLHKIIQSCVEMGLLNKQLWESERVVFSDRFHDRYLKRLEERQASAKRKRRNRDAANLEEKIKQAQEIVTGENRVVTGLSQKCPSPEDQNSRTPEDQNSEFQNLECKSLVPENQESFVQPQPPKNSFQKNREKKAQAIIDIWNERKPDNFVKVGWLDPSLLKLLESSFDGIPDQQKTEIVEKALGAAHFSSWVQKLKQVDISLVLRKGWLFQWAREMPDQPDTAEKIRAIEQEFISEMTGIYSPEQIHATIRDQIREQLGIDPDSIEKLREKSSQSYEQYSQVNCLAQTQGALQPRLAGQSDPGFYDVPHHQSVA